jgi:hypothetical protein
MSKERQEHFQALCEEGAARLGVKADAAIARRYATLQLGLEAVALRLINGSGNPDTLVKIEDQLAALMPPPEPPTVTVKIIGTCIHCDREFDVEELAPHRSDADKLKLGRTIDADPVAPAAEPAPAATAEAVKALPAAKVEPLKPDFHPATDFHKNAPLRNGAEAWRPFARQAAITDGGMTPYHILDPKPGAR